jgi:hypothetical protein
MLEPGANDCSDDTLDQTRANLDLILVRLAASHVAVLVIGTSA